MSRLYTRLPRNDSRAGLNWPTWAAATLEAAPLASDPGVRKLDPRKGHCFHWPPTTDCLLISRNLVNGCWNAGAENFKSWGFCLNIKIVRRCRKLISILRLTFKSHLSGSHYSNSQEQNPNCKGESSCLSLLL